MRDSRLQNRMAESALTFPTCVALTALLWCRPLTGTLWENITGGVLCLISVVTLITSDAYCKFVRKHTQFAECYWLLCVAVMGFFRQGLREGVVVTLFAASFYLLLHTYQQRKATGTTFNAFALLAIGSMGFPPLLCLCLCYWWYMYAFMRCLTGRTLMAGLIGLATPFWFVGTWCLWTGQTEPLQQFAAGFEELQFPQWGWYASLTVPHIIGWSLTLLLALVGSLHYLANCYDDNISVRMCLYVCVCQTLVTGGALAFQPTLHVMLLPMAVLSSAPLVSHYFSLSKSRVSHILFILTLIIFAAMAMLRLWMPSFYS